MSEQDVEILRHLSDIKQEIASMKQTINRMDTHISFIESVYDVVKIPFLTLMNVVSYTLPTMLHQDNTGQMHIES